MRKVTKADCKRDIDDGLMQMVRVSQHREGTLKPASCKVLGERLSGTLVEQFLHVSPRHTERPSESHLPAKRTLDKLGIPRATFYRWYDRYREGGPEALADHRSPTRSCLESHPR